MGLRILAAHHACALLLRMGNYFIRTTLSAGVVVWEEGRVKVSHSRPDPRTKQINIKIKATNNKENTRHRFGQRTTKRTLKHNQKTDPRNLELWDCILSFFVIGKREFDDEPGKAKKRKYKKSSTYEP